MIKIAINDRGFRDQVRHIAHWHSAGNKSAVLNAIGRDLRDAVRNRFKTSGFGSWAELSPWTRAKTGRTKPLTGLFKRVGYRVIDGINPQVEITFDNPSSEWNINMHDQGYTSPAVSNRKMAFPLRNPNAIGSADDRALFRRRKASVTPARRIWLTPPEVKLVVERIVGERLKKLENKLRKERGG